ncbi:MAG TPA: hypothetical protein VHN37_05020 [Actinomycetota bacterium]|nr:hypothetical protein [Actinomycetota bacterium]
MKRAKKAKDPVLADLAEEDLARLYGVTRLTLGIGTFLAPSLAARVWMGRDAAAGVSRVALRGLGGREAALGLGLLSALERGHSPRPWLEAGAVADAGDALGTLSQRGTLPASRWMIATAIAGASAWFSVQLASAFED